GGGGAGLEVGATHGERLFALHGVEDGGARVLFGPHPRQPTGPFGAHIEEPAGDGPRHARLYRSVRERVSAEEVVLAVRYGGVVRVGRGPRTPPFGGGAPPVPPPRTIPPRPTRVAAR